MSAVLAVSTLDRAKEIAGSTVMGLLGISSTHGEMHPCVACSSSDALRASKRRPGAKCFSCGAFFTNIDLVMHAHGVEMAGALEFIARELGWTISTKAAAYHPRSYRITRSSAACRDPDTDPDVDLLRNEGMVLAPASAVYAAAVDNQCLGARARAVLAQHGIDPDFAESVGLCSIESRADVREWSERMREQFVLAELFLAGLAYRRTERAALSPWIPYPVPHGMMVIPYVLGDSIAGLRFRRLDETVEAKYKQCRRPARILLPWGADALRDCDGAEIHVTEGELDAIALQQRGHRAVALPGATPAPAVLEFIAARVGGARIVMVWTDPDAAGISSTHAVLEQCADALGESWVDEHMCVAQAVDAKDPCELLAQGRLP